MTTQQAGDLDLTYGDQGDGLARIPPLGNLDPDVYTLLIGPSAWANEGSAALYGYNPDDPTQENKVFTRIHADGRWDRATGHVPISKNQNDPMPLNFDNFATLCHTTGNAEGGLLTAGYAYYFEDDNLYQEIVVGRYTQHFLPWPGFADDGIATTRPVTRRAGQLLARNLNAKASDYRSAPKMALAAGLIRVVFNAKTETADGELIEETLCVTLDPGSGIMVNALGPGLDRSRWALPTFQDKTLDPYRAVFLNDGGFFLLAAAGTSMYLLRFKANAELETSFAGVGFIELPLRHRQFGLAIKDELIVVSSGATFNISVPSETELYGFNFEGHQDERFRRTLKLPDGNLSLVHIAFDEQGRLVLAGQRYYRAGSDPQIHAELRLARLLVDGTMDLSFGKDGFSDRNDYLWASNGMHVNTQGIRVLTLMPVGDRPFYEMIARFLS
ncbi:delta-60 repeat domain-containing protein [Pseudomonas sp. TWI628]|uniref:delta-60 repeat domain-containing protein n=1 Tax=Pseudomonas sp. TWI628 TaxID=3136788 RepID=UPI0032081BA8